jgi:hypothetical protein
MLGLLRSMSLLADVNVNRQYGSPITTAGAVAVPHTSQLILCRPFFKLVSCLVTWKVT